MPSPEKDGVQAAWSPSRQSPIGAALHETIGDRADRQRARPAWLRAIETPPQMRAALQQRCKQSWPALSAGKCAPANNEAKICDIVLHRFQSGISARKKKQFNRAAQAFGLRGGEPPVQFEPDEIVLRSGRPPPAAQVMFARRKEYFGG